MSIDASSGAFSWTPTESQDGDHTVAVSVNDGTINDQKTITVSLFSNPVDNELMISRGEGYAGLLRVRLMDLSGRLLLSKASDHADQSNMNLDMREVPTGLYLVEIELDNGTVSTQKIIRK